MAKVLVFFTASYPFGQGETFIENEITYLAEAFDKIVIVSNNTADMQTREIPSNIVLERKSYKLGRHDKIKAFVNIFNPLFMAELKIIKTVYKKKLTRQVFNTMILSLQKTEVWAKYINQLIKKYCSFDDEIYLYSYWANDIALAISSYDNESVKKKICRAHRWDIYFEENSIGYLPFRDQLLSNIDEFYSISNDGIAYLGKLLKKEYNSVKLSRLGVDIVSGINENKPEKLQILSVSNLIPVKNVKLLIDALSLLGIDFYWTHIGAGPLKEELEKYAEMKIKGKYHFLGARKNLKVKEYLANEEISFFINVSLSEGIPVSIMEAMSYGIPCFATNVGGNSEIVDEKNGLLLPKDITPEALAEKFEWFYKLSNAEKSKMRESAYQTWDTMYNAEKNYKNFVNQILCSV